MSGLLSSSTAPSTGMASSMIESRQLAQLKASLPSLVNRFAYLFAVNYLATMTDLDERALSGLPFDGPVGAAVKLTVYSIATDFVATQARAAIGFNVI